MYNTGKINPNHVTHRNNTIKRVSRRPPIVESHSQHNYAIIHYTHTYTHTHIIIHTHVYIAPVLGSL